MPVSNCFHCTGPTLKLTASADSKIYLYNKLLLYYRVIIAICLHDTIIIRRYKFCTGTWIMCCPLINIGYIVRRLLWRDIVLLSHAITKYAMRTWAGHEYPKHKTSVIQSSTSSRQALYRWSSTTRHFFDSIIYARPCPRGSSTPRLVPVDHRRQTM